MMAQLKVGNQLATPKAIHVFKNGEWQKKRMAYVYKFGQWVPVIKYTKWIYQEGVEHVGLELIYDNYHENIFEKRDDHLYFYNQFYGNINGKMTVSTDEKIEISSFNKLCVEIEKGHNGALNIGLGKDGTFDTYEWLSATGTIRKIVEVDISELSGLYNILITSTNRVGTTISSHNYIYNVWLE